MQLLCNRVHGACNANDDDCTQLREKRSDVQSEVLEQYATKLYMSSSVPKVFGHERDLAAVVALAYPRGVDLRRDVLAHDSVERRRAATCEASRSATVRGAEATRHLHPTMTGPFDRSTSSARMRAKTGRPGLTRSATTLMSSTSSSSSSSRTCSCAAASDTSAARLCASDQCENVDSGRGESTRDCAKDTRSPLGRGGKVKRGGSRSPRSGAALVGVESVVAALNGEGGMGESWTRDVLASGGARARMASDDGASSSRRTDERTPGPYVDPRTPVPYTDERP